MGKTKIAWTSKVWNPATGCSPISDGCLNCYARRMATRLAGRHGYPKNNPFQITLRRDRLDEPLHWKKPSMVFASSMGDLFHPDVPDSFILDVWKIMEQTPMHSYQVLTKRPTRMRHLAARSKILENVWLGVTIESARYAGRADDLLAIPAAIHFLSIEPMLGPPWAPFPAEGKDDLGRTSHLDWVIVGCESGPGARLCSTNWIRGVVRMCKSMRIACFVKQIRIDAKLSKDPREWPKDLRVQEYPRR